MPKTLTFHPKSILFVSKSTIIRQPLSQPGRWPLSHRHVIEAPLGVTPLCTGLILLLRQKPVPPTTYVR